MSGIFFRISERGSEFLHASNVSALCQGQVT